MEINNTDNVIAVLKEFLKERFKNKYGVRK